MSTGKAQRDFLPSLVLWLGLMTFILPLLIAWQLWSPLDNLPYWLCFGVGLALSLAASRLWSLRPVVGRKNSLGVLLVVWFPVLSMGLGLGANVLLDGSPAVRHETTFLGRRAARKGPAHLRFASWRRPGDEETLTCTIFRADLCFDMNPGERLVVATHHGALGWEWIADVAVASEQTK